MNRMANTFPAGHWRLTFIGGPMGGRTIPHPDLPPRFGKRDRNGNQFYYVPGDVNRAAETATMILEESDVSAE